MSWPEVLGFAAGALSVWLYVRQSVWAWPTGIANSAFWLILFWEARLFLDAGLHVVYIVLCLLGLRSWRTSMTAPATGVAAPVAAGGVI